MIEQDIYNHSLSTPGKTALIQGETEVSYAQLWQHVTASAERYRARGLQPGDRVVLSASKDIRFVYAYFGAHLAGLITVPIDQETNLTRLNRIVDCAQPRLMVGKLVHHGDYTVEPFDEVCGDDAGTDKPLWPEEDTIADLMFTTGTTGLPKGVALSYANEAAAAENINSFIGNTAEDVELMALPISHSFGLGRLRCVLSKGGTLVMLGSFASMKKFYGELDRCQVTGFGMVPASWAYIRKMSGDKIGQYVKQLRYIEIGSAYMPAEEKHRLMGLLPDTHICMHYGLTEASRSCFISFPTMNSISTPSANHLRTPISRSSMRRDRKWLRAPTVRSASKASMCAPTIGVCRRKSSIKISSVTISAQVTLAIRHLTVTSTSSAALKRLSM